MKRIYILLLVCMGAMSVMAQGQKLRNRIIDKDHYPVDSAKVTVKGTNISTTTDKNGNFVLENAPLALDSLQVQKGKKNYVVATPVHVEMRTAMMDRFSWYVKGGVEFAGLVNDVVLKDGVGFYAGAGLDVKMSRHWAFQPALYLSHRNLQGNLSDYYYVNNSDGSGNSSGEMFYEEYTNFKIWSLEVPLLFALKYPLGRSLILQIQFGCYVDIGLGGDTTTSFYSNSKHYTIHDKIDFAKDYRFTGGAAYGIGFEYGHILFGVSGRAGYTSVDYSEGFTSVSIEVGYKF